MRPGVASGVAWALLCQVIGLGVPSVFPWRARLSRGRPSLPRRTSTTRVATPVPTLTGASCRAALILRDGPPRRRSACSATPLPLLAFLGRGLVRRELALPFRQAPLIGRSLFRQTLLLGLYRPLFIGLALLLRAIINVIFRPVVVVVGFFNVAAATSREPGSGARRRGGGGAAGAGGGGGGGGGAPRAKSAEST